MLSLLVAQLQFPSMGKADEHHDGFYFGGYDIRTPCVQDFQQGRNFKVMELNGVTSEATHIYDPKSNLWEAYKVMFAQWALLFRLVHRTGCAVATLRRCAHWKASYSSSSAARS